MKFCGIHRLGKLNRSKTRPLIARFTCRADRDEVWKCCYRLKNSNISMGEDLPKQIQDIRKKVLIPAMKKIKKDSPQSKATVLGDRLVVNGKRYYHYDIPISWLTDNRMPSTSAEGNAAAENTAINQHYVYAADETGRGSSPLRQDE